MQCPVELLRLLSRFLIVDPKKHEFRIDEVVDGRAHGDEKRVVAELHVAIEPRQNLPPRRARQHRRDHDHNLVFTFLLDRHREVLDRLAQVAVIEVHSLLGQPGHPFIPGVVRRLHRHEYDFRVLHHLPKSPKLQLALSQQRLDGGLSIRPFLPVREMLLLHSLLVDVESHDVVAFQRHRQSHRRAQLPQAHQSHSPMQLRLLPR